MTDAGKPLPEYSLRRVCDELEYLQRDVKQKVCCALMGRAGHHVPNNLLRASQKPLNASTPVDWNDIHLIKNIVDL